MDHTPFSLKEFKCKHCDIIKLLCLTGKAVNISADSLQHLLQRKMSVSLQALHEPLFTKQLLCCILRLGHTVRVEEDPRTMLGSVMPKAWASGMQPAREMTNKPPIRQSELRTALFINMRILV